jgi:hypothetical protein
MMIATRAVKEVVKGRKMMTTTMTIRRIITRTIVRTMMTIGTITTEINQP